MHSWSSKRIYSLHGVSAEVISNLLDQNRPGWMKGASHRYRNDFFSGNQIVNDQFLSFIPDRPKNIPDKTKNSTDFAIIGGGFTNKWPLSKYHDMKINLYFIFFISISHCDFFTDQSTWMELHYRVDCFVSRNKSWKEQSKRISNRIRIEFIYSRTIFKIQVIKNLQVEDDRVKRLLTFWDETFHMWRSDFKCTISWNLFNTFNTSRKVFYD